MQEFTCPTCGITRIGQRRRCYPCTVRQTPESREKIRQSLIGVRHSDERRRKNSDGHKGAVNRFDLGAATRGEPAWNRKPVGYTRVGNHHIQIKCADGKFRYRARVMWAEANGPIPDGLVIHHINEDPFDDRLDNFQMLTNSEHRRIHTAGEKGRRLGDLGRIARYGHK